MTGGNSFAGDGRPADDAAMLADEIAERVQALPEQRTESIRSVRRAYSRQLRSMSGEHVVAVAEALVSRRRWVAYELIAAHPEGWPALDPDRIERLGRGMDDWGAVDAFGRYIAGPAWQRNILADDVVRGWAGNPDRWWRRAALVATVPLNLRSAGGTGDTGRTLDICGRLVTDADDMVVKALSWALRALVPWDPAAVQSFVALHEAVLASRVRREVASKLATGRKR